MGINSDQTEGLGKQIKGAVKDAWGGATNDPALQAEGKADKAEGKLQKGVGDAKEKVKDGIDKI
jgi:uncharacterized protein YjbJ (UPF0337 family)